MDRDVPPRVTYWTGVWAPSKEAISSQVEELRSANRRAKGLVVVFGPGVRSGVSWSERVVRLDASRWIAYRALARLAEPLGDVTHVFSQMDAWHPLRVLGRRPLALTVVQEGPPLAESLYRRVGVFVAETASVARALRTAGVDEARIRTIYPGVDLTRFVHAPVTADRPLRLLFASTPSDPDEIDSRGVPLLVEVARRCPEIEIQILWRRWGDERRARAILANLDPPSNVRVDWEDATDMPAAYHAAHGVIVCFAQGKGKSCPLSILEALACGRPVLMTDTCGLADVLASRPCAVVAPRDPAGLAAGVSQLACGLAERSADARAAAEELFDLRRMRAAYQAVYDDLLAVDERRSRDQFKD
jgi:glycosyltransferase involved in cell wall biosynthesis